jgi:hypothetical protein
MAVSKTRKKISGAFLQGNKSDSKYKKKKVK